MAETPYPTLFSPVKLGSLNLSNRVVSTSHSADVAAFRPGVSAQPFIDYTERRARGGAGLIILQALQVHRSAGKNPAIDRRDMHDKLSALAEVCHRHGTPVIQQLLHSGAAYPSDTNPLLHALWSFSGTLSSSGEEVAHEMSADEIEQVVAAFADAAELAVEAGLDGVELNATHGYLIQQSFTPAYNRRTDEWGDPMQFVTAIIQAIRERVGRGPALGVRISADDFLAPEDGGLGPKGLQEVVRSLSGTGLVDYFNQSEGSRASHYARSIADYRHPHGEFLPLARELRTACEGLPLIGTGRITTPELAETALAAGDCDLVALTRAQIADADFVAKARSGESDRIRPCVGANQGCIDRSIAGMAITCFHNPDVLREHEVEQALAEQGQGTVLVVGGGPAGLKAAEFAARKGRRVVLAERSDELGGLLRVAGYGAKRELVGAVDWLAREIERLEVDIRLGVEVDEDFAAQVGADVVVLATGARCDTEPLLVGSTDRSVRCLGVADAMGADVAGQQVVIYDRLGNDEAYTVAERLTDNGAVVTVMTPLATIGANIGFTHLEGLRRRLHGSGTRQLTDMEFTGVRNGEVLGRHTMSGQTTAVPADLLVAAVPRVPNVELTKGLRAQGARVLIAGDAYAPRSAMHAFREGADVGASV
ncbi:FAD-dependent oxidoreductase [Rhodococcus sp. 3A]|nr:FAD-dependent oxidoreductase [Rhodococcus sp. 3A]MBC2640897.1 FAD-dependent oxidoreductase [Rhodococcus sp. 3A]MBC2894359.1 FAD-dependent oxidoreductase [Rhodococcus sp. 4CII]